MPMRRYVMAFLLLSSSFVGAQAPSPTATYALQAERPPKSNGWGLRMTALAPTSVLAVTPDRQTVLALIPQQNPHWKLSVLSGWETSSPHERTMDFDGHAATNRLEHITGRMTPTPDGKSVLVRIMVFHLGTYTRRVVVLMIDLEKMQLVWRQDSSDPLLANSRWKFSEEGTLIAAEGPPPAADKRNYILSDTFTINPSSVGEHDAAALSLPDLKPSFLCRYKVSEGPYAASAKTAELETDACRALLTAADVTSALDLPGAPVPEHIERAPGSACTFVSLSKDDRLALYKCGTGSIVKNGEFWASTLASKVINQTTRTELMSISEPLGGRLPTELASAGGHDYLVRLRDGTNFEAYRLP